MLRWLILSLLLIPLFDARAAGDEAAVRATFAAYKAAVLAQQGERAADNVTTGTLREYARYRELALSAPRAALEALPMTERLQVLIIRARVPAADLRAMDGRRVFTHAVDRGWIGREGVERSELGTVQVDYNLPERFDLHYTGADNKPHRPVMVHRAPFGSMERFTGLLIEHFEGKFPTWLSPEQVRVLPISDKVMDVAAAHRAALAARGVRVTVDETPDKIGAKIRNARLDRVPYMLVLGQREAEEGTVSVRHRDKGDLGAMPFEQFADVVVREIAERHISPMI